MTFFCGSDTITVRNAALKVDPVDGSQYRDWTDASSITETEVARCSVQDYPGLADTEDSRAKETVVGAYQVWMPEDAPIIPQHTSRVEFDGVEYEVKGNVRKWRTHAGALHHYHFLMALIQHTTQVVA